MSWEKVKLNKICRPRQWKTLSMENLLEDGYPVYGANGKIGFYDKFNHEFPTLLITCRGATCGSVHISEPKSYINGNAMALDELSPSFDNRFLYYYFLQRGFSDVISGSAQPQITGVGLDKVKVPNPPLHIQKQIAHILDKADALRKKDQQLLQKYDELAQAIFIDMFGDPVKNEMGWEVKKLSDVVDPNKIITYGIVQAGENIDGGIPYIRTGDIKNGKIITEKLLRTTPEIAIAYKRSEVKKGDIIMSIRATVGTVALLPDELDGANLTQGTARISPSKNINRLYLFAYLKSEGSQNWISRYAKGATFREITLTRLRELPILVPPLNIQDQYSEKIKLVEDQLDLLRQNIFLSHSLFRSLLQKAFTGELIDD